MVVVDTSVLIEIEKGNKNIINYVEKIDEEMYIPWIVLYEFLFGFKYLDKDILSVKDYLETRFIVVWMNQKILLETLNMDVELKKKGKEIPFSDILIVATAKHLNQKILTCDKKHFERIKEIYSKIKMVEK